MHKYIYYYIYIIIIYIYLYYSKYIHIIEIKSLHNHKSIYSVGYCHIMGTTVRVQIKTSLWHVLF